MIRRMAEVKIDDIAQVERAKNGKIYPAGCTLIALSATKGEVEYLEEDGEVETRYAVIIPDKQVVSGRYLYCALCYIFPEFLHKHRTGINLQFDELRFLKVAVYSLEDQQKFVEKLEQIDRRIRQEDEIIIKTKDLKQSMLERLFPQ